MIIALSVYAGKFKFEEVAHLHEMYSWSFVLGWVSVVLYLISAAVYGAGVFFVLKNVRVGKYQSLK